MSAADTLAGIVPADRLRDGGDPVVGAVPEATLTPTSVDEVAAILEAATSEGFGVVPAGGRTDLGPRPPEGPFVVLSTRGLRDVEVYEPADLTMSAGAGTTLAEVAEATVPNAQWLPFDPESAPARTLGGLAATGVRAPLCASYGAPRDHILGLTLVTGDGRVLKLGGRVMKNVAGFDLVKLVVGSRGTLGVVVSTTVRLFPRPEREVALVLGGSAGELVAAARAVATAPVLPASAVLVDGPREGSTDTGDAALVVRLMGAPETVEADAARLRAHVGLPFETLEGAEAAALFREFRDHVATDDVVVRLTTLPASLGEVLAAVGALPAPRRTVADVLSGRVRTGVPVLSEDTLATLGRTTERLGGSCVLERGPAGLAATMPSGAEGPARTLSTALRARFDPQGVLWPGGMP